MEDSDAIRKKELEMQANINKQRDTLRKIQAPNMRAMERLCQFFLKQLTILIFIWKF